MGGVIAQASTPALQVEHFASVDVGDIPLREPRSPPESSEVVPASTSRREWYPCSPEISFQTALDGIPGQVHGPDGVRAGLDNGFGVCAAFFGNKQPILRRLRVHWIHQKPNDSSMLAQRRGRR